jgi:flavin reductase (DIM6/NTAB) family NADH-FMN oxidoreductase RutF
MEATFTEIAPGQITANAFRAIGQEWMLITAGTRESFNTMTASWGTWGELWGKPVAICFIRPHRHTFGFMEVASYFTLSHFEEEHRPALDFCGSKSGRDVDKIAATGLTPIIAPSGAVYFAEARLVLECRKLYAQDIEPEKFVDKTIAPVIYPRADYHRMYVGEVVRCLMRG